MNPSKDLRSYSKPSKVLQLCLRAFISLFGVLLISTGATFLKEGMVGLDPFTALSIGLTRYFPFGLGIVELVFNMFLFVIVLFLDRHTIGIGTFFNMILSGFCIQYFSVIYQSVVTATGIPVIVVDAIVGILVYTLGVSLYMQANLGVAPYDAIAPIIVKHTHLKYQWVRSAQDLTFMVLGLIAHGAVGFMTVIVAFFTGPLVNFWTVHVSYNIVHHTDSFSHNKKRAHRVRVGTVNAWKLGLMKIRHAYRATYVMQHHISTYSNRELYYVMKNTSRQLRLTQMAQRNLQNRYATVQHEINLRRKKDRTIQG